MPRGPIPRCSRPPPNIRMSNILHAVLTDVGFAEWVLGSSPRMTTLLDRPANLQHPDPTLYPPALRFRFERSSLQSTHRCRLAGYADRSSPPQGGGRTLGTAPSSGAIVPSMGEMLVTSLPLEGRDEGWGYSRRLRAFLAPIDTSVLSGRPRAVDKIICRSAISAGADNPPGRD